VRVEALHDVVVIGAGAAGVSAAIECFDIQLDVVVLESASKVGGQIDQIPHTVRNVAPAADGNEALVGALARHASTLGNLCVPRTSSGLVTWTNVLSCWKRGGAVAPEVGTSTSLDPPVSPMVVPTRWRPVKLQVRALNE
jgi:hypothetical protein